MKNQRFSKLYYQLEKTKLSIRAIFEKANKIKDCIRLDMGQPDLDPPKHLKEKLKEVIENEKVKYTSSYGRGELRKKIEEYERALGKKVDWNDVVLTIGGNFALFSAISLFRNKKVGIFIPYFPNYVTTIISAGAKPVFLKNVNDLEKRVKREKLSALIINTPTNPSGKVWKKDELKEIWEISEEKNISLISDEVYDRFVFKGKHYSPYINPEKDFLINSLSKSYSMTGYRIGWVANKNSETIMKYIRGSITCVPYLDQRAAEIAMEDKKYPERIKKIYKKRRDVVLDALEDFNLESFSTPEGAFYVLIKVKENSWDFAFDLLRKKKVAVVPGEGFGIKGYVRLALIQEEEKIYEALKRIREMLR